MDRRWIHGALFTPDYIDGVRNFMKFVEERFPGDAAILCPCSRCINQKSMAQRDVERHILLNGMSSTYTRWIHHGEANDVHVLEEPVDVDPHSNPIEHENNAADRVEDILTDLMGAQVPCNNAATGDGNPSSNHESVFKTLMEEAKHELYPGCTQFSRFSFVVKMLHLKSYYRISNSAFSAQLKVLRKAFPENNCLPNSYEEAKKMLRTLGLGYVSIHVCPNNCVLFRKEYAELDTCPVCQASRWKDPVNKKVPEKVLRHFPLIPRLQRIFATKKTAEEAQWHKLNREPKEKEMSHPADGEAWKDFDKCWPDFAEDARNLRLGLATDGFNPFGNMRSSYSMWPIFVIPYNFPPWSCMQESNFMMALLIPGPRSPGKKHFDVFLQPLIEELLSLSSGVDTVDALTGKDFKLRAAVLWCIHDYPALSTLSGRTTQGFFACLHCDKNPLSYSIRNKLCYIGHCRFLPRRHRLRTNNEYASLHESKEKPGTFTTEELLEELAKVNDVRPGQKRKRSEGHVPIWGRRVSLWDLPYWPSLKLRHNLDVMHIEKNICENLLGTLLGIHGKSKDNVNARLDLADLNIKPELQLQPNGDDYHMPEARYTLSREKKIKFCKFLKETKFPDSYAANIERCITAEGTSLHGLKTHDCHILLQRILPAGMRGILDDDICLVIAELGKIFRELCSQTLNKDILVRMKTEIPAILCKLEKLFPPAFFDVMVHLAVHLPDEAMLRGPVQFGWMYPVERRLYTLKRSVRNKARPEGSIAEAYVADEALTFCSRYMDDVETRFNRAPRNPGFSDPSAFNIDGFGHGVNLIGACDYGYSEDFDQMVWYILYNCDQAQDYIKYVLTSLSCTLAHLHFDLIAEICLFTECFKANYRKQGCKQLILIEGLGLDLLLGSGTMLVASHFVFDIRCVLINDLLIRNPFCRCGG